MFLCIRSNIYAVSFYNETKLFYSSVINREKKITNEISLNMWDNNTRVHHSSDIYTKSRRNECGCCQQNRFKDDFSIEVPKLLRCSSSSLTPLRPRSPKTDDHRRVSVIRTAINDDLPTRRTHSVSSIDQQSIDSYYSERSISPLGHPLEVVGNRHQHCNGYHREVQLSSPRQEYSKREQLAILQSEHEKRLLAYDSNHHRHRHHRSDYFHDYRDIPSPNYQIASPFLINTPNRHDVPSFNFTPYLDGNLRHKFTELSDFSIKKRHRTIFTPSQLRKLEEKFSENKFIVGIDRSTLANQLKLKEHQVKIWFQNRRTKVKQQNKDGTSSNDIDVIS